MIAVPVLEPLQVCLPRSIAVLSAVVLAGCAGSSGGSAPVLSLPVETSSAGAAGAAGIPATSSGYKLTDAEAGLDCPKLTGQMKVRIANMRAAYAERSGTKIGQSIQSVVVPVFGGTSRGVDPNADLQLDRAKLEAFNRRLAEKKCKTLDIDAELRGETPAPAPAPKRS